MSTKTFPQKMQWQEGLGALVQSVQALIATKTVPHNNTTDSKPVLPSALNSTNALPNNNSTALLFILQVPNSKLHSVPITAMVSQFSCLSVTTTIVEYHNCGSKKARLVAVLILLALETTDQLKQDFFKALTAILVHVATNKTISTVVILLIVAPDHGTLTSTLTKLTTAARDNKAPHL